MRLVIILCGPPGAGKTTAARANTLGLTVYDQDDPQWATPGAFTRALSLLGRDPSARAVVIRSGATSSARIKARALTQATHCYLIPTPADVAAQRVRDRGRNVQRETAAVRKWWSDHDTADRTDTFPGWDHIGPATAPPPRHNPKRKYPSQTRGYGHAHRQTRAAYADEMAAGKTFTCARVGMPADQHPCTHPRDLIADGDAWDLGHRPGKQGWSGPEHVDCNRRAGQADAMAERTRRERAWVQANVQVSEPQSRTW